MPIHSNDRQAFTLIEMMISVALGTLVAYVAFAGLRSTAQAIATAQRLAVENSILRAGMSIALHDNDFWTSHDDPMDCTKGKPATPGPGQSLRQTSTAGSRFQGLPFTPFISSTEYKSSGDRMEPNQIGIGTDESPTGWDPNAWGAHESRGWAWGNLAERVPVKRLPSRRPDGTVIRDNNKNIVYYSTNSYSTNDTKKGLAKRQVFGAYSTSVSPRTDSPHRWQQRQLDGLKRSLGSYGMFEYIPPNSPLMIYSDRNPVSLWSVSPEWCYINSGKDSYYLGTDDRSEGVNFAQDTMLATYGTVYAPANPFEIITSASAKPTTRTLDDIRYISNRRYGTGISLSAGDNDGTITNIKNLMSQVEVNRPILDATSAPVTWPSLNVSTLRHRRTGASLCLHRITWTSPLTGAQTEFTFTAYGTTLRGARQQRLRDEPGWIDPFPKTGAPLPNLDSY